MANPDMLIFYVANPTISAGFYTDLLARPPVEASPGFALFALESGLKFGLWKQDEVAPHASVAGGGGEIAFMAADKDAVLATHADWQGRDIKIAQSPTTMDFGFTFTALDPDGHRLRVFAPGAM